MKAEAYRKGRARTDGTLVPVDHFRGDGEWSNPDGALMAVEITSRDRDTDQRDRIDKPVGYAAGHPRLPPHRPRQQHPDGLQRAEGRSLPASPSYPWGATVEIPTPVDITLKTEKLKDYAD